VPIPDLARHSTGALLRAGINPAGYTRDVLWADPAVPSGNWRDLYDWNAPTPTPHAHLTPQQTSHLRHLEATALSEFMDIVFASGSRSLESLLLALPTTDRITHAAPSALIQEAADGVIALLGARKRFSTRSTPGQQSAPAYVLRYLHAIATRHG